jgi:hypothetical protein
MKTFLLNRRTTYSAIATKSHNRRQVQHISNEIVKRGRYPHNIKPDMSSQQDTTKVRRKISVSTSSYVLIPALCFTVYDPHTPSRFIRPCLFMCKSIRLLRLNLPTLRPGRRANLSDSAVIYLIVPQRTQHTWPIRTKRTIWAIPRNYYYFQ